MREMAPLQPNPALLLQFRQIPRAPMKEVHHLRRPAGLRQLDNQQVILVVRREHRVSTVLALGIMQELRHARGVGVNRFALIPNPGLANLLAIRCSGCAALP